MIFKSIFFIIDRLPEFPFRWLTAIWVKKLEKMPFGKNDYFFIFPHSYCLDGSGKMTQGTENGLLAAIEMHQNNENSIILLDAVSFPAGEYKKEFQVKKDFLLNNGVASQKIVETGPIENTVGEVKSIVDFFSQYSGDNGLMVIMEEVCASGQLLLWKKCLPGNIKFGYTTVKGAHGKHCRYLAQKSERIWLLASVFRYWLFFFFGKRAGFIKEPADE